MYKNDYRLFKNYFAPCFKLKEKIKVGSRYKRIYDGPKTPLERVLESDCIPEEEKQKLKEPPGYTWHHKEDGVTMELIPADVHAAAKHTGGASVVGGSSSEF